MSDAWGEMATVGIVARPHGLRGLVVINPETDFPEDRYAVGRRVWARHGGRVEALAVTAVRFHQGRPVVGFEGVDTVEAAETLRGAELRVPEEALAELPSDTFYIHDLVGCRVVTVTGRSLGRVVRVDGSPAQSWVVVDGDGDEVLVPLVEPVCVRIDPAAGEIVVDPPDGLLDVNAPGAGRTATATRLEAR